jgi:hypothetical protein
MIKCIACGRRIWPWQKAAASGVVHQFCDKIWNLGYEARRKLDHMVAEKHGIKTASDLLLQSDRKSGK